jgi:hypothetical protein
VLRDLQTLKSIVMAVILNLNYTKKLGLPQYSSHACSISVQVEINDLNQVPEEASRLYGLLQNAVDHEIQSVGFLPDVAYGIGDGTNALNPRQSHDSNGIAEPRSIASGQPLNGHSGSNGSSDRWHCTEGQRGFILRLVHEHQLEKEEVEALARRLFQAGVKDLNRMQASSLIELLLEQTGRKPPNRWRTNERIPS